MISTDTIFAVSTGSTPAAIAVIRMSGRGVREILEALTGGQIPAERQFSVRRLVHPRSGDVIDVAGVLWMAGPRSFTGEDSGELHIHGSRAVITSLFSVFAEMDNFRMAEPGEFTRRALTRGKVDLVEVEALGDLLSAQTDAQRRLAVHHLLGEASSVFERWRLALVSIRGLIEAAVDFSDEDGVAYGALAHVDSEAKELLGEMLAALDTARTGELLRDGVRVVLAGRPNTGKSSLLNAIVRREAALVSPWAGTTRDVIDVTVDLGGVPVVVSDTAGLRDLQGDPIERAGVEKARAVARQSDLVIWVCAPDVPGSEVMDEGVDPAIVVVGKSDLGRNESILIRNDRENRRIVRLSASTGDGVADLLGVLTELVKDLVSGSELPLVTTGRQANALRDAISALKSAIDEERMLEVKAEHVRRAAYAVGRITGQTDVEEWLGSIFSRFCIGK